jgi:hypothetical protein
LLQEIAGEGESGMSKAGRQERPSRVVTFPAAAMVSISPVSFLK